MDGSIERLAWPMKIVALAEKYDAMSERPIAEMLIECAYLALSGSASSESCGQSFVGDCDMFESDEQAGEPVHPSLDLSPADMIRLAERYENEGDHHLAIMLLRYAFSVLSSAGDPRRDLRRPAPRMTSSLPPPPESSGLQPFHWGDTERGPSAVHMNFPPNQWDGL